MGVWFTSDLHLGGTAMAERRGLHSADEAGYHITESINESVHKKDKLYILGDFIDRKDGFKYANQIRCKNIELILGNHDIFPLEKYFEVVQKIHAFKKYKDFWLSHAPIHPFEIRNQTANIHGHCHIWGDTEKISDARYFNVNPEYHNFKPVSLEQIQFYYKPEIFNENFSNS